MSEITHPVAAIGAVVLHNDAVLLVKRKYPPHKEEWAIPGGKILTGETLQQAAEREVFEETGIQIKAGEPVFSFDIIEKDHNNNVIFHYVIIDLACSYISGEISAYDDALDVIWANQEILQSLQLNTTTRRLLKKQYGYDI